MPTSRVQKMCTVQVLLFADICKRTDVQCDRNGDLLRPAAVPRNICRRLFVDENEQPRPSNLLRKLEADLEKQVKERWNFDFRSGKPLPGRYQWVNVKTPTTESSTDCETAPQKLFPNAVEVSQKTSDVPRLSDRNGRTSSASHKRALTSTSAESPLAKKRKSRESLTQCKITDFLQQKKRHSSDDALCHPKLKCRRLQSDLSATSH